jgi:hypothetical protein
MFEMVGMVSTTCARIQTDVEKHHGFSSPVAKAQQPRPPKGSGFFISPRVARGTVSFLVDRVGHSQECAGSFARSTNPHGLPPSFSSEGAGLEPVAKEPFMANSLSYAGTTPTTPTTHFYGQDLAEMQASAENALSRALRELRSDNPDFGAVSQSIDAAAALAFVLKLNQGGAQ